MVQQMSEYKEAYTKESEKVKQLSEFKEAFLKESEKVQQRCNTRKLTLQSLIGSRICRNTSK